ncbi:MAG: EamA family transporter [Anaerolineales bacterium]|nr:EamA family transporter [Chloroflexota bacterium]MBL6983644.1 EamA family transporter [Anaerolineales bacterium]
MFAVFWALQIFISKLGFIRGAQVIPYQIFTTFIGLGVISILIVPGAHIEFAALFKNKPGVFWKLYAANVLQSGVGNILSLIGIALTAAINAGFLVKISTVTTILFAWIILKEKLSPLKIITMIVMLIGAYLLTTKGQTLLPRIGDLFILGACVCWSLGTVFVAKILKAQAISPDVITIQKPFAGFPVFLGLAGVVVAFPDFFASLNSALSCCTFASEYIPYALGSGLSLALTWIFLLRTLNVTTASYMTMMSMITPVVVSILAIIFLGETLVWIQILGMGMILLSGITVYFSDISHS